MTVNMAAKINLYDITTGKYCTRSLMREIKNLNLKNTNKKNLKSEFQAPPSISALNDNGPIYKPQKGEG